MSGTKGKREVEVVVPEIFEVLLDGVLEGLMEKGEFEMVQKEREAFLKVEKVGMVEKVWVFSEVQG